MTCKHAKKWHNLVKLTDTVSKRYCFPPEKVFCNCKSDGSNCGKGGIVKINLPESKDKNGYTSKEIDKILHKYGICRGEFSKAAGVNTMCLSKTGEPLMYKYDVYRFLNKILNGVYTEFD